MEKIRAGSEKHEFSRRQLQLDERVTEICSISGFENVSSMKVSPLRSVLFERLGIAREKLDSWSTHSGYVSDNYFPEEDEKSLGFKNNNHPLHSTGRKRKEFMENYDKDTSIRAQLNRAGSLTDLELIEEKLNQIETDINEICALATQKEAA